MSTTVVLDSDVAVLDGRHYAELMGLAAAAGRRRARICLHRAATDAIHEMVVCLMRDCYIRPHRHQGKTESMHVIQGQLSVVLFDEAGKITTVIAAGPYGSQRIHLYRLSIPIWHTVLPESDAVLFHETINGPFLPDGAEFAPWAPEEGTVEAAAYVDQLRRECRNWPQRPFALAPTFNG